MMAVGMLSAVGHDCFTYSLIHHQHSPFPMKVVWSIDQQQHRQLVFWRLGKLRFGVHGVLGIASVVLTECARRGVEPHGLLLLVASQLLNAILASHARSLLSQVPPFTQIVPGVVAPHREAFARTISCIHYLVARVACKSMFQHHWESSLANSKHSALFYVSLAVILWRWWPLVPSWNLAVFNGNTWIFVIPIWIGVTGDLWQFCHQDRISMEQLLRIEMIGLLLAFGFTLAFRNYVPMPVIYAVAAAGVWQIIQEGCATIASEIPIV